MEEKIRVVIATGIMNAGGAETLIMELLREKSSYINYTLLIHYEESPQIGVYDEEIKQMNIPVVYIPSVGSIGIKQYEKQFCKVMKQIGHVDVLHSHLNAVGGIITKAAKQAGIQNRVVHCHADVVFKGSKINIIKQEIKLAVMKMYVNKYATYFWACSDEAGRRLFYRNKKQTIIPNVINVNNYLMTAEKVKNAKLKFQMQDQFVIGAIGRIARIKNYEFIIRLLAQMKEQGEIAQFVCFGRVVDEVYFCDINRLAEEIGVMDQVHFMGNSMNISSDIGCFDVFLMPSYSEGFGMAALEAQAAGIPAIVSTGVPKLIDVGAELVQFIPLEDRMRWINSILNSKKNERVDNQTILKNFNARGYNSEIMVCRIEEQYRIMKMENS